MTGSNQNSLQEVEVMEAFCLESGLVLIAGPIPSEVRLRLPVSGSLRLKDGRSAQVTVKSERMPGPRLGPDCRVLEIEGCRHPIDPDACLGAVLVLDSD